MDHELSFESPDVASSCDVLIVGEGRVLGLLMSGIFGHLDPNIRLGGRRRLFLHAVFFYYWRLVLYDPKRTAQFLDL